MYILFNHGSLSCVLYICNLWDHCLSLNSSLRFLRLARTSHLWNISVGYWVLHSSFIVWWVELTELTTPHFLWVSPDNQQLHWQTVISDSLAKIFESTTTQCARMKSILQMINSSITVKYELKMVDLFLTFNVKKDVKTGLIFLPSVNF